MKVEVINQLKEYTINKEMLLLALNLGDEVKEVLELYKSLKEYYQYTKGNKSADKIVKIFIEEALTNNNDFLKQLLKEETVLRKLMEMQDDVDPTSVLKSYIAITREVNKNKKDEDNKEDFILSLLMDKDYKNTYGLLDHIALLNLTIIYNGNEEVTNVLTMLVNNNYEYNVIKSFIDAYNRCKILEQKYLMRKVAKTSTGIKLPNESLISAGRIIPTLDNPDEIKLVQDALNEPEWQIDINFQDIYEIIKVIVKNKYKKSNLYFKIYLLESRTNEEIIEMMQLANESPEIEDLIFDHTIIRCLTWDNQKNLIRIYNLKDEGNRESFYQIYRRLCYQVEKNEISKNDLYGLILNELDKEEYITTVEDYLKTVKSVDEFIKTINDNFKESDDILPTSSLRVRKQKSE